MNKKTVPTDTNRAIPTWMLLVLSGILLGLAFPPNPIALFGSIGLVPLLYALQRADSYGTVIRWSYVTFAIFSALSTWWVGSWQPNADPFLMISCVLLVLIHPLFFIVPIVVYHFIRKRSSRLYALAFLPFLWCGGEYLHALTEASYPWLTLGNTQTYNIYYIQFIEFTGVWGLSFLLLVQNSTFTAMLFALDWERSFRIRTIRTGIIILAVTLVPPFLYGFYVLGAASNTPERTLTITAIQPNQNPWDKWNVADTTNHIQLNASLSFEALTKRQSDLFLWAENAIPYPVSRPGYQNRQQELYRTIDSIGVPVMTGFPDFMEYPAGMAPPSAKQTTRMIPGSSIPDTFQFDYFNSVGLFVPGKGLQGSYRKMQLVPFGERIPFVDNVPFLIDLLSWDVGISSWGLGQSITLFNVPNRGSTIKGASVICFESIYPNIVRKFADNGAQFLTVVTNDGWYLGTPGPIQHERFAILRAIETRRAIARAANTGISCFVTPYGVIFGETEEGVQTTTTGTLELRSDKTLYTRWGDWWPITCLIVALGMAIFAFVRSLGKSSERKEHSGTSPSAS